jgi:signal transduction histidine kinase/DNA-binding response OmpR family regulator
MRILLILLLLPAAVAGQMVQLDSTTTTPLLLSQHGYWLVDSTSSLTVEEVADRSFLPLQSTNFRVPFSDNTYWYRLTLSNSNSKQDQWYLEWQTPVAERVEFYDPQPDGTYRIELAGTRVGGSAIKSPGLGPHKVITLAAGGKKTIFIKIKSQRGHRSDLVLYDPAAFFSQQLQYARTDSFFNGLVIIRLFYILLLALFAVKEVPFRAYSFMLVIRSLSFWGLKSTLGSFFTTNPTLATFINFSSYHVVPIGYVLVVKALLPTHRFPVFVQYLLNGIMGLVLVLSLAMAIDYSWYWLLASQYLTLLSQVVVFVIYAVAIFRRYPIDWYYSVPFLLGMGSFFFLLLSAVGLMNAEWVFTVAGFLFVGEIFVFGLFLGKIIINFERAQTISQKQLLFNQHHAAKLQELDTLKSNFFANISHEFRTPLTLLVGPLDDFQKKYPSEKLIPAMQRNVRRLQGLINQLLDLSKLEARRLTPRMVHDDLATYLRQIFASFESLAQSRSIMFNYQQTCDHRHACFDPDMAEKIATNLLSNAFKFTPEGGRVNVRVDYTENDMILKVQDFGIGIEAPRLHHIFDRFYQIDSKGANNYEGTGIGLSLVNELVEVLRGKIWVESEPGLGSTFTVKLPIDPTTWADHLIPDSTNLPQTPAQGLSSDKVFPANPLPDSLGEDMDKPLLLVVEDNPDLRFYIRTIFEGEYRMVEAVDGQDGLNKAYEHIPDLAICDVMMPRLNGFDFCRTLKTDARTSHIPVVMLTAKATLEDRLEGLELGADDYLLKPFVGEELQKRLQNLLKQREVLRQRYSQQLGAKTAPKSSEGLISVEDEFLKMAIAVVTRHISDSSFSVQDFASTMNLSRTQLHRKLKALTNRSSTEFIRNIRLSHAAELLRSPTTTVSEAAYRVGFESLSYFSKAFQEQMGISPSEWHSIHQSGG